MFCSYDVSSKFIHKYILTQIIHFPFEVAVSQLCKTSNSALLTSAKYIHTTVAVFLNNCTIANEFFTSVFEKGRNTDQFASDNMVLNIRLDIPSHA